MKFPMTLTHRANPLAQIVVANAEQLADVPAEFLPPTDTGTPAVVAAAAAIPGVNLAVGTGTTVDASEDAERRQSLDEAVDEFTAHVQAEETRLAAARAQLDADRAALDEQIETLVRERAEFEALRATAATGETGTTSASAEGAATGETTPSAAAPAKRTRANKEGA